jgi:EAL domain-containing protein (putative c-di-GMP-specific phosphodiesterase class I)
MGRGRVELFDDELRRLLGQGRRIARSVGSLLEQPRLPLVCRPIVHLGNGGVVGFDCDVDWETADIHESPQAIAHVIEEAGMSRALDIARVRTLLAQLAEWEQHPPGAIVPGLSITLTRTGALSPLLPELVRDMLAVTRVVPSLCWLGVPELAVATDLAAASHVVVALDELGVGVALRDFGSALSSLEQLRELSTPTMSVAGPLVEAVHHAPERGDASTALLGAIVKYARALGRIVVAFGIHDAEHADRLRELGCEFGSGPAFGPRLRPADVGEYLRSR